MPRSRLAWYAAPAAALLFAGAFAGPRLAPAVEAVNAANTADRAQAMGAAGAPHTANAAIVKVATAGMGVSNATADTAGGAALYRGCAACHGQRGEGLAASKAPAIAGLPAWYVDRQLGNFLTGVRGASPGDVEGAQMRAASSALQNEAQRTSVATYLASLPRPNARPRASDDAAALANGRNYFNALCSACHGANGMGNQSLGAPPLAGATADYLMRQFAAFKSGRRGAHPQDKPGAQMRAIAAMLPDARTERDVIAYAAGLGP